VQMLIFDYPGDDAKVPDCLIMTSGNTSGAPICRDDEDAVKELGFLCDAVLSHNRLIRIRADDSVMDYYRGKPYMIRRSRGFAPLPFMVSSQGFDGSVLAIGGELKNTFCVSKNDLFYASPYIGDMEDVRTVRALRESVVRMEELLEARPEIIVCDMHPAYHSSESAEEISRETGVPLLKIQHHYAHVLSCMAENDYAGEVIGVSFDGTGYGEDGTIWGGEIMTADYDGYLRKASIEPFLQAGGDMAAREGWRIAVSLINDCFGADTASCGYASLPAMIGALGLSDEKNAAVQLKMMELGVNTVTSTSAGRLFDAVSALLGICRASTFEGDASTKLEFAAEAFEKAHPDEAAAVLRTLTEAGETGTHQEPASVLLPGTGDTEFDTGMLEPAEAEGMLRCRTKELFGYLVRSHMKGADSGRLSYIFHAALAAMAVRTCVRISSETGIRTAALSGGVYQNGLFLRLSADQLEREGFKVLTHSLLPPNDGGICLGQAVYGARYLKKKRQQEADRV